MIGQNPKTSLNHADDFSDITALLQSMPRVSAPKDFNASLKARIAAATAEEKEFAGVTAMIKELPRVTAPADFDFRLRARIAQAKAEQEKVSAGWLSALFGQSFSWLQASAAMAAVALVVSVVTWGTLRSNHSTAPIEKEIAANTIPAQTPNVVEALPAPKLAATAVKPETFRPTVVKNAPAPTAPKVIKAVHSSTESLTEAPEQLASAPGTVIIRHRNGEERRVNLSEPSLGLQPASLRTAPAVRSETTLAANIY
ncbi:MAG: hypothetical protein U0Y68_04205 [Blastocatellia bacterium]